jgi:hypothetical protein
VNARASRDGLTDFTAVTLCLLRLVALWVLFVIVGVLIVFKKLVKSKTMWLAAVVGVLPALPGVIEAAGPLLGEHAVEKASAAVAVLIALARLATTKPIAEK